MIEHDLNSLWFLIIGVLWVGYFFLEGFDFGVGILMPLLARDDLDRRLIIRTIGPVWDGNEVWLVVAVGATFAAFPDWYATLLSGFYPLVLVVLLALIARGVAFEFRGRGRGTQWSAWWDRALFWGSLLPAALWGMVFANLLRGVPIDQTGEYAGSLGDLLGPYALLGGLTWLAMFTLHGATFIFLKTTEPLMGRARTCAIRLAPPTVLLVAAFGWWTWAQAKGPNSLLSPAVPAAATIFAVTALWFLWRGRGGWAFLGSGMVIVATALTPLLGLYPRLMPSTIGAAFGLDIHNAAASPAALRVITVVALTATPIVIAYQAWSYWVFHTRLTREHPAEAL
jgi:cytochrome d ubiquinol oxidase subunit II